MDQKPSLWKLFRKLSFCKRKELIKDTFSLADEELRSVSEKRDSSDLADALVENAIGTFPLPMGLATGFLIDGKDYVIPMATEEPSVIAAAVHGALFVKGGGGFKTSATEPIMTAQVFLENCAEDAEKKLLQSEEKIRKLIGETLPSMTKRGGGFCKMEVEKLEGGLLAVSIHIDVRDAMGANVVNTAAESAKALLSSISGGSAFMAILTNASEYRRAKAEFEVPEKYFRTKEFSGQEVCKKIVKACFLANAYPKRAVTHNKGIMNGISALALATGNDTRAVEAAAHFAAIANGSFRSLTSYSYEEGKLKGSLEMPIALGTVGGSISCWPAARLSLKILKNPSAQTLSQIAVSLGLAQNLAALFALVTEGIQPGHMKLHAAKLAYQAGARGKTIRLLAEKIWKRKDFSLEKAKHLLEEFKD